MAGALSIGAQDAALRAEWPSFRKIIVSDRIGLWRGWITAFSKPYLIEVRYVMNDPFEPFPISAAWFPEVRVLEPRLEAAPRAPGEDIPHIYGDPDRPDLPILCLFDPRVGGWSRGRFISDTIIPWTASWLRFYEIWQATGEWHGGGAEHAPLGIANDVGPAPQTSGEAGPGRAGRRAGYRPAPAAFWRQWRPQALEPAEHRHAA